MLNEDKLINTDTISKILQDREAAKAKEALVAEDMEEYKQVLNRLFSSSDGLYFIKKLIKYCEVNSVDTVPNPYKLIEDGGKRKVFFELIRPYLETDVKIEIERQA